MRKNRYFYDSHSNILRCQEINNLSSLSDWLIRAWLQLRNAWHRICLSLFSSFLYFCPKKSRVWLHSPTTHWMIFHMRSKLLIVPAHFASLSRWAVRNVRCHDRIVFENKSPMCRPCEMFRTFYNVKINWSHPKRIFDVFGAFVAHASALTFRQWMCSENMPHKNVGSTHWRVVSGLSIPITFVLCSAIRLLTPKAYAEGVLGKECLELNLFSN